MATYVRQSSFSDGDTITAALFNNEFNQLVNAFNVATGHTHDGSTAGDGGPISNLFSNALVFGTNTDNDVVITFNANSNDGVLTWMEDEDYFQFSDDLLLTTTEKVQFRDTAIYINSSTDGQLDIVADTEIQIAATTIDMNGNADISGNLGVGGNLTVTGTTTFNGGTITMGDAATDNVVFGADVDSNIIPDDDDSYDLGSSTQEWRNLYIDGTANIDSLVADTADINGGTIDAANITVGSGKTLDVSAGSLTLADNQISGDKVEGGTINATTINTLTYGSITDGTITVTAFVDEDNMASNSATLIPTQQSVKAYVDAQDTAQDLDLVSDSGTIAIDLDGETLTVTGGEGIDTSASSNTLTITGEDATTSNKGIASFNSDDFNVSSGAVTLATTSTAAELNLLDGTTAGTIVASKGVAVDANKDITGFRNITLTGELDAGSLDISGNVDIDGTLETDALSINGTTVTATAADINLIDGITNGTVIASKAIITDANKDITGGRNITISGELDAATLDISGNADIDGTLEADAITIAGVTLAETISDTVGAMVASNTETGIAVTYDDADNTLDFVIGDNAIVQSMIADNAIDSQMYVDGSIDLIHMSANSVDSDQYVDGSIDTAHIADSQITSAKIVDGTIATGDIADDAVTGAKLANNIDIAGTLDVTGVLTADSNVVIAGNLTVQGDTTTLNTATLDVEDKNITLNKGAGDTSGSANGAGLTIQDAVDASNDATILWDTTNDEFDFSHPINVAGKVTSTGTSVFASLDISGDIDVDGTTNLDVVDIDGAVAMATSLTIGGTSPRSNYALDVRSSGGNGLNIQAGDESADVVLAVGSTSTADKFTITSGGAVTTTGVVTANAGVVVDNITIDGTTLSLSSGDLTLDVANNIILDADGGVVYLNDGGVGFGQLVKNSNDFRIFNPISDGDIVFRGNDGGSVISTLTLDMSAAGAATFNGNVNINSDYLNLTNAFRIRSVSGQTGQIGFNRDPAGGANLGESSLARFQINGPFSGSNFLDFQAYHSNGNYQGGMRLDAGGLVTVPTAGAHAVFNENGVDADFRVESNSNANLFYVDGGNNSVGIGTPPHANNLSPAMQFLNGGTMFGYGDAMYITGNTYYNNGWKAIATGGGANTIIDSAGFKVYNNASASADAAVSPLLHLTVGPSEMVINDDSYDYNLRVESNNNANMLFVDGGNDHVNIGTGTDFGGTLNVATTDNSVNLVLACTSSNASEGPILDFTRDAGNVPSDNDIMGRIRFRNDDTNLDMTNYVELTTVASDVSNGTEDGQLQFNIMDNGTLRNFAHMTGTTGVVFNEDSNDIDFRVESNGNANLFNIDGGADEVRIGTNAGIQSIAHLGVRQNGSAIEFGHENNGGGYYGTLGAFGSSGRPYIGFSTFCEASANTFTTTGQKGSLIFGDGSGNLSFAQVPTASATGQSPVTYMTLTDAGALTLGSSTNASTLARLDHENSGGKAELQLNSHGSASFSMLSNFTGSTVNGVATGNFGLVTPHNAAISIVTSGIERIKAESAGNVVINESGADADFRVESDGNANMFYVDGGNNKVGVGTSSPGGLLELNTAQGVQSFGGTFDRGTSNAVVNIVTITTQSHNCGIAIYGRLLAAGAVSNDAALIEFWAAKTRQSSGSDTNTAVTPVVAKAIAGTNIGAGTLAWSGDTLQYTPASSANYIGYQLELSVHGQDSFACTVLP